MAVSNITNNNAAYRTNYNDNMYDKEQNTEQLNQVTSDTEKKPDTIEDCITISQSGIKAQATNSSNLNELTNYLSENYESVRNGTVAISKSYLRKCLNDDEKRRQLEKTLSDVEAMIKDAEENLDGYIGMKVKINTDGEVETESYGGAVVFNEAKRAAQIAAAMTGTDIKMIMGILNKDLTDCESGLKNGFCDENEVKKVKAMIQKAQAKQMELAAQERSINANGKDTPDKLTINLLI